MRPVPEIPFTSRDNIPGWTNFHHTIVGRSVPAFLTPGLGTPPLPGGPPGEAAKAQALNAILTYCLAQPPERLCTLGARWSLSNVLDPGNVILDPGVWNQLAMVDTSWLTDDYKADAAARGGVPVVVQGGTQIGVLNDALGKSNLALQTSGASDGHRIAGCIATGSHGSDLKVGAVHDTILAVYLVIGPSQAVLLQPSRRRFSPALAKWFQDGTSLPTRDLADDELFNAARVALGALGFVHSVVVEAVPLYQVAGVTLARPLFDDAIWKAIETLDTTPLDPRPAPDFFTVVLSPYASPSEVGAFATLLWKQKPVGPYTPPDPLRPSVSTDLTRLLSALIPIVDGGITDDLIAAIVTAQTSGMYTPGPVPPTFPGTYFGPTTLPEGNGRSSEVAVDHRNARAAVTAIVSALRAEGGAGRHMLGGLGVRFVPGTTALLGMNSHPMNTYIEFPSLDTAQTTRIHQAIWAGLRAAKVPFTCHWGQEYGMDAASVRAFYGDRVDRWKAARARLLTTPEARVVFNTPLLASVGLGDAVAARARSLRQSHRALEAALMRSTEPSRSRDLLDLTARSGDLRHLLEAEIDALYAEHTAETGQLFPPETVARAFALSQGHPWLVSALALHLVDELVTDRTQPVTPADVDRAVEILVERRDPHLDAVIHHARQPRIRAVLAPVLAGGAIDHLSEEDLSLTVELGLVRRTPGGLEVSNPIYRKVLLLELAATVKG